MLGDNDKPFVFYDIESEIMLSSVLLRRANPGILLLAYRKRKSGVTGSSVPLFQNIESIGSDVHFYASGTMDV